MKTLCQNTTNKACLIVAASFSLFLNGCEKKATSEKQVAVEQVEGYFKVDPVDVPALSANNLGKEPTDFLRSRSDDAIYWQPWSPKLLEQAEQAQRPVFALITSGKYPNSIPFLDGLTDPANGFVETFNENYVCSLVDLESHPEMSDLAVILSQELGKPLFFPFLLWMSHEGNPIAWLPIDANAELDTFSNTLDTSSSLVTSTWYDSQDYAITNSQQDNRLRIERQNRKPSEDGLIAEDQVQLLINQTSFLTSLYDPATQSIDRSGGLVPTGFLRFLSQVSDLPELPNFLRNRCVRISDSVSQLLATEPITDLLNDGLYTARATSDWSVPSFVHDLKTQSEMVMVYALAHGLTNQPENKQRAQQTLAFAESVFGHNEVGFGTFQGLREETLSGKLYLLSIEDYQSALTEEEFRVLRLISGLSSNGNIPPVIDPSRKYLRKNILKKAKSVQETAVELSLPETEVARLLESAKEKLSAWRTQKAVELNAFVPESTRITEWNALHAQALFQAGRLFDDPELTAQGRSLLQMIKQDHYDQFQGLWRIPPQDGRRGIRARGRDYACLLSALLEAYRAELNSADLIWAEALARESVRTLKNDKDLILEAPVEEILGTFTFYSSSMVIGQSTWGSLLAPFEHFRRITVNSPFAQCGDMIMKSLHASVEKFPMNHTDYLCSLFVPVADCVAVIHGDLKDAQIRDLHRHLLLPTYRGVVLVHEEVLDKPNFIDFAAVPSEPGVTLYRSERKVGSATNVEELRSLLESTLEPR